MMKKKFFFVNPEKVNWRVFMFQLGKNNFKLLTKIKIAKY